MCLHWHCPCFIYSSLSLLLFQLTENPQAGLPALAFDLRSPQCDWLTSPLVCLNEHIVITAYGQKFPSGAHACEFWLCIACSPCVLHVAASTELWRLYHGGLVRIHKMAALSGYMTRNQNVLDTDTCTNTLRHFCCTNVSTNMFVHTHKRPQSCI